MGVTRIGAVLLDMDGLLLDTERLSAYCREEARKRLGFPPVEDVSARLMGLGRAEIRRLLVELYGPDYPFEAMEQEQNRIWDAYMAIHHVPALRPGVFTLLDYLKEQGIPCAVGTSTDRESALPMLEGTGIMPYLKDAVFGDMVARAKPAPDIFLAAAERLGVEPERSLVLEDSPNGIRAAHQAGMIPVMVPDVVQPDESVKALTYAVVKSLAEVPELMEKLEAAV